MRKRTALIIAALVISIAPDVAAVVYAQAVPPQVQQPQPPPTPDSLNGAVGGLWNSVTAQLQTTLQSYQRVYQELQKAEQDKANMDAYLRACADHPGCSVPVPGSAAPPPK